MAPICTPLIFELILLEADTPVRPRIHAAGIPASASVPNSRREISANDLLPALTVGFAADERVRDRRIGEGHRLRVPEEPLVGYAQRDRCQRHRFRQRCDLFEASPGVFRAAADG